MKENPYTGELKSIAGIIRKWLEEQKDNRQGAEIARARGSNGQRESEKIHTYKYGK